MSLLLPGSAVHPDSIVAIAIATIPGMREVMRKCQCTDCALGLVEWEGVECDTEAPEGFSVVICSDRLFVPLLFREETEGEKGQRLYFSCGTGVRVPAHCERLMSEESLGR
ncbi:unnamed protein product [Boreogadus saida]